MPTLDKQRLWPFPTLETERLMLTDMEAEHAPALYAMRSDEEVMRYLDRPLLGSLAEAEDMIERIQREWAAGEIINWAVCLRETGECIGYVGFYRMDFAADVVEIGYTMAKAHWRRGYGREALRAVLGWAFESFGAHKVSADVNIANEASMGLLERLGFQREAVLREDFFFAGRHLDSVWYGLLREEWG